MKAARTRFARRALAVLAATVVAVAGIAVTVVLLLRDHAGDMSVSLLVAGVATLLLLGLRGSAIGNSIGLARIARLKPGALVFLARREPTLAPDLPRYLHQKGLAVEVGDRWLPAVVDERGIAAWSGGFRPRELVLMEWSELGEIVATEFRPIEGSERFGITVDVRPFPTPLVVRVGYAMVGLQGAFDRSGTIAVSEAANSRRPTSEARP